MPSFFVDRQPQGNGDHVVHERSRCPPHCFPPDAEYLGELLDANQALALAVLKYRRVKGCLLCATDLHELVTG